MFSQSNNLRNARAWTVAFLTLKDGEEARREANWEGRCSDAQHERRPLAPAVSSVARRGRCQRDSSITTGNSRVAIDL